MFYFQQGVITRTQAKNLRIITISVAAMGAILNTAVILVIIIDPLKTFRKGAWITILNLAIADFITCISTIGIWGDRFLKLEKPLLYYDICQFTWSFSNSASFFQLTFFTVQIYVITKFPLKSRFIFTEAKIVLVTLGVWLFSFLLGLSELSYIWFPLKACLKIYAAQISFLEIAVIVQVILNIRVAIEITKSRRRTGNDSSQKHRRIAKTVITLTLILFFTAFPFLVFRQIEYIFRLGHLGQSKTAKILGVLTYCYAPIAMLNFTANPILYSLRLPDYRRALFWLVKLNVAHHRQHKICRRS